MYVTDEDDRAELFTRMKAIALSVLNQDYSPMLAASTLLALSMKLGIADQKPFSDVIASIESDSHGLPIFPEDWHLYSDSFLAEKRIKIAELEAEYREEMFQACKEILALSSS